jgi:MFS family permease
MRTKKLTFFLSILQSSRMLIGAIHALYLIQIGISLKQLALLQIIFSLTVILFEFPTGVLADIFGRKKSVLISAVLFAGYYPLCIFSPTLSGLILSEIIYGLAVCFSSGSVQGWLATTIKEESSNFDQAMTYFTHLKYEMVAVGMMFFGFAGSLIAVNGTIASFRLVYGVATIVMAIVFWNLSKIEDFKARPQEILPFKEFLYKSKQSLATLFNDKVTAIYATITALVSITYQPILHFWQPLFNDSLRVSGEIIRFQDATVLLMGVVFLFSNFLIYIVNKKIKNSRYLVAFSFEIGLVATTLAGAALFLMGSNSGVNTLIVVGLYGTIRGALSLADAITEAEICKAINTESIAGVISGVRVIEQASAVVSLGLIGKLIGLTGIWNVFQMAAVPILCVGVCFYYWKVVGRRISYVK